MSQPAWLLPGFSYSACNCLWALLLLIAFVIACFGHQEAWPTQPRARRLLHFLDRPLASCPGGDCLSTSASVPEGTVSLCEVIKCPWLAPGSWWQCIGVVVVACPALSGVLGQPGADVVVEGRPRAGWWKARLLECLRACGLRVVPVAVWAGPLAERWRRLWGLCLPLFLLSLALGESELLALSYPAWCVFHCVVVVRHRDAP